MSFLQMILLLSARLGDDLETCLFEYAEALTREPSFEVIGVKLAPCDSLRSKAQYSLWRVSASLIQEIVFSGISERVWLTLVEVAQRIQNVLFRDAVRYLVGHYSAPCS